MNKILKKTPSKEWKDRMAGWFRFFIQYPCGHTGTVYGTQTDAENDTCDKCNQ